VIRIAGHGLSNRASWSAPGATPPGRGGLDVWLDRVIRDQHRDLWLAIFVIIGAPAAAATGILHLDRRHAGNPGSSRRRERLRRNG